MSQQVQLKLDPESGKYNARDVLSMCRVYVHLREALANAQTENLYAKQDRPLARIALQMTAVGLPIDLKERARIRELLVESAARYGEKILKYTRGEYYDVFLTWVASYQARGIRKDDPIAGQFDPDLQTTMSEEAAYNKRVSIRRAEFEEQIKHAQLYDTVYRWVAQAGDQPVSHIALAESLGVDPARIGRIFSSWGRKGIFTVEKIVEGKGATKRTHYNASIPKVINDPEAYKDLLADTVKGINANSKIQQAAILRVAGVTLVKMTEKTGLPQIDKEVLESFAHIEAARDMLQFVLADKAISFVDGFTLVPDLNVPDFAWLHPSWDTHKITGRWGSSPNCFDGETEILTRKGWVRFDQLELGMSVAQYDKDSTEITWTSLREGTIVRKHFKGEMVSLRRRNIDLLVTPDHRLLLGNRRTGVWEDVLAQDFMSDRLMPIAGKMDFTGTANSVFGETPLGMIGLMCAAQADGTWNGSGWAFKLTRVRKIKRLKSLLVSTGLEYTLKQTTRPDPFQPGKTRRRAEFYVHKSDLGDEIAKLLGPEKTFPWQLLRDMNHAGVEAFLTEIMLWDGSLTRKNCYSSSNKQNADFVQALFVLSGKRARIRPYKGSSIQKKINWQVDVSNKSYTMTTNTKVDRVPWDGAVYCVSVPSSYIVVRRNHNVMIVGQCQNWSKRAGGETAINLRRMICAPPGYVIVGADYAQLEARLLAAQSQDPFLLNIFKNNLDIHTEFGKIAFPTTFPQLAEIFAQHKKAGVPCGPNPNDPKSKCDQCKMRDKLRDLTKRLEYGGFYGAEAQTVWESIVKDEPDFKIETARFFLSEVNRFCNGLRRWQAEMLKYATKMGEVRSPILGRVQFFPMGRVDPNVIANYPNQSGGADLWGMGALRFAERYDQMKPPSESPRIMHNGHDSVGVLTTQDRADEVCKAVEECWYYKWNDVEFIIEPAAAQRWSDT